MMFEVIDYGTMLYQLIALFLIGGFGFLLIYFLIAGIRYFSKGRR